MYQSTTSFPGKNLVLGVTVASAILLSATLYAKPDLKTFQINIESQEAGSALMALADVSGVQIMLPQTVGESVKVPALHGQYTINAALDVMLEGTGLGYEFTADNVVLVKAVASDSSVRRKSKKESVSIEEMIVTAQKREQNIRDVPISISALGATELEQRGISGFEDLGMAVPGLSVSDHGAYRKVFLRGIGNTYGWSASLVGIYVDNVSVAANPSFALDLRPYDMERVEVLKGPQGTLYGDGSVGGTIRFISKDPELDRFGGKVDVEASFTKSGAPSQKIQSAVNIPVIEDELAFRVVSIFERDGGWIDQPAVGREDINDHDVTNIRVKGLWTPNESFRAAVSAIVHRNDGSINAGEDNNGNYNQFLGVATTPDLEDDYEIYDLTLNYSFDSFEIVSSTSHIDAYRRSFWEGQLSLLAAPPAPALEALFSEYPAATRVFSEELRFSSLASGPWNWTVGAFYRDRTVNQSGVLHFGFPDGFGTLPPGFAFVDNQNTKSLAIFGDASFQLTDRLEIGAGIRHFDDDRTYFDGFNNQENSFSSVSPRVYVNLDVTDSIKTYASVAKGFRSGGFNSLGQPKFGPETVWTYEVGTKMSFGDGRLDAEMAFFYSEYEDYQIAGVLPPPAPPLGITTNAGNAEIKGIDWALTWSATDNLMLQFNGNIIDTEIVKINALSAAHDVGDSLDMIPDNSFTLSAAYDFEIGYKPGVLRFDYNRRGKASLRNRSIGDFYYDESDVIDMLNAVVEWQWNENVSFGFFGKNLLNDRGYTNPFALVNFASRSRPRTFGVKVGMQF